MALIEGHLKSSRIGQDQANISTSNDLSVLDIVSTVDIQKVMLRFPPTLSSSKPAD